MSPATQPAPSLRTGCIFLPVAPRANARRRFGEPSSPGRALGAGDVVQWLDRVLAGGLALSGAGVAGPGEPLAEPAALLETLRAVHGAHPELPLFLVTNGLCPQDADMPQLARELAAAGLSRATVLVDAVDPALIEQIFAWIRPGRRTLPLPEAARLLADAQALAVRSFREAGLVVTVRMTVYPGVNDQHVEDVANAAAVLGADLFDLRPCPARPEPSGCAPRPASSCAPSDCASCGSASSCAPMPPFAEDEAPAPLAELAPERLAELKAAAARYLRLAPEGDPCGQDIRWMEDAGQAGFLAPDGPGLPCLLETRDAPEPGGGDQRWIELSETLRDCFAILAASAGAHPREVLAARGLAVLTTETDVQAAVDALYGGGKRNGKKRVKVN